MGATAAMALAIWVGATFENIHLNHWVLIGLFVATLLAMALRIARRTSLTVLSGGPVAALWVATRFIVVPAAILVALVWLVCWALGLAVATALLKALTFLAFYGAAAILATSILADVAAAIKGPGRAPPSDG